jgi:hypothetical protein
MRASARWPVEELLLGFGMAFILMGALMQVASSLDLSDPFAFLLPLTGTGALLIVCDLVLVAMVIETGASAHAIHGTSRSSWSGESDPTRQEYVGDGSRFEKGV